MFRRMAPETLNHVLLGAYSIPLPVYVKAASPEGYVLDKVNPRYK